MWKVVRSAGSNEAQFTWFSRNGERSGAVGPRGQFLQPRVSPNGDRVAFTRPDDQTGNRDIWYIEFARGVAARLTTHVANDLFPVWSPNGRQILFGSDRGGDFRLPVYLKKSMDPGSEESLLFDSIDPYDWSRDGKWISCGSSDLWVAPASAQGKPFQFYATPFIEGGGRFSPDVKWIAYSSNETGRYEIYVRPFSGAPAGGEGKIQLSNNGGDFPVWRPDGQELFYLSGDLNIYAVNTKSLGSPGAAPLPARLFRACPGTAPRGLPLRGEHFSYGYDTHDGQQFLVNCLAEAPGRFIVLMNGAAGSKAAITP